MSEQSTAAEAPARPVRPARDQYIDVLRGLAILLVVLRHAWPNAFPGGGIVGVTLFFGLSGYVITRVIDRDLQSVGRPRFGRFYLHRLLRLYPALILVTVVYALVTLVWSPDVSVRHIAATSADALLYLSDFPHLFSMPGGFSHLWTLSIEEQFYLVWPVLLWGTLVFTRRLGRFAVIATLVLTVVCILTLVSAPAPASIYKLPTTWASSIAIGGAAYFYRDRLRSFIGRGASAVASVAVVALLAMTFVPDAKNLPITYIVGPALIAICAVVIVNWATTDGRTTVEFAPAKPLLWLGRISYGVYLWNLPVTSWWGRLVGHQPWWVNLALIPLSIAPAVVSWYTVEAGGRALRRRFDARVAARSDVRHPAADGPKQ